MKQFENYLSQITEHVMRDVVVFSNTDEFLQTVDLLKKYVRAENVYYAVSVEKNLKNISSMLYSYSVNVCYTSDLCSMGLNTDMVVFYGSGAEGIDSLPKCPIKYMMGRMDCEQDYFSFWEKYRENVQHMYIEQSKSQHTEYEIFEWEKTDIELSVIVPVYNVADYLPRCIESLIEWKAPYVEYLFVDDGSADESAEIIHQYSGADNRIRLIQKKNGGCASARNRGLKEARGRYIGFVDADDFVACNMFYKLLKRAFLGNYDYTYCGFSEYYEDTQKRKPVIDDCLSKGYLLGEYDSDKVKLLAVNTRVAIWRGLYKKSILEENHIKFHEKLKRFDDLPFRVEYIFAAQSAICIPEYLYNYRIGREGQDTECTDDRLYVHFQIFKYLDRYVKGYKDQRIWDILQAVKIQTHRFALSKIEQRYRKKYVKMARQQLKEYAGFIRTAVICLIYAGRKNIGWLIRLWFGLL